MNLKALSKITGSQSLRVIDLLKRSEGLTVRQLADALRMSYMGVKAHCLKLERLGIVEAMREPKAAGSTGRPEISYRLTAEADPLFAASQPVALEFLEAAKALYGALAGEKLLFRFFEQKGEAYAKKCSKKKTPAERLPLLIAQREAEGCLPRFLTELEGGGFMEYHQPLAGLFEAYPNLLPRLEEELISRALGVKVTRASVPGGVHYTWES